MGRETEKVILLVTENDDMQYHEGDLSSGNLWESTASHSPNRAESHSRQKSDSIPCSYYSSFGK